MYEIITSESKTEKIERKNVPRSLYEEILGLKERKKEWEMM